MAATQATFGGESLYENLVEIAAAYLFYLCCNHPFFDGNKRAALAACLVFLRLNGLEPTADGQRWEDLTSGAAASCFDRDQTTQATSGVGGRPSIFGSDSIPRMTESIQCDVTPSARGTRDK